jgi:hypothetical protein
MSRNKGEHTLCWFIFVSHFGDSSCALQSVDGNPISRMPITWPLAPVFYAKLCQEWDANEGAETFVCQLYMDVPNVLAVVGDAAIRKM